MQLCAEALCLGWYLNLKSMGPWKTDLNSIVVLAQCIQRNPHVSTRRIQAHTGIDRSSTQKMLKKDLHMKAYHPPAAQALKAPDAAKRVKWAEDLLDAVILDFTYPDYILWTDEAIFHLNGTVNRHNAITWATHVYIERDTQKKAGVMLWVGLIKDSIIGPFFFDSSVTGGVYLNLLKRSVWPALRALMRDEIDLVYFQQDGASAHYSKVARRWLDDTFKERWIGKAGPIPWPARSPDLSPLDFWLWGYLRNQVYGQQLDTLTELRRAIKNAIQAIPARMVHNATLKVVENARKLVEIQGLQLGIYN